MSGILDAVAAFFDADEWSYVRTEEPPMLRVGCRGDHGEWTCHVMALEEPPALVVYSSCPFEVPAERRHAVGELLIRATWALVLGTFEMDFRDGEVRYRTGQAIGAGGIDADGIGTIVFENVLAMDRYLPAIEAVAWLGVEPAVALELVDHDDDDHDDEDDDDED